jgi:hypothetical protein
MSLVQAVAQLFETASAPEKILGFAGRGLKKFTFANDSLTEDNGGGWYLFNGVCDFAVNKACETVHELYLNGQPTGFTTHHTFVSPSKVGTIAIVGLLELSHGDVVEVFTESNTDNTTMTFSSLSITLTEC